MTATRTARGAEVSFLDTAGSYGLFVPAVTTLSSGHSVIDTRVVKWNVDPYGWSNDTAVRTSPVIAVQVTDSNDSSVVEIVNLSLPIVVDVSVSGRVDTSTFHCGYWSDELQAWSTAGTILVGFYSADDNAYVASCAALHLTDFAGVVGTSSVTVMQRSNPFGDAGLFTLAFSGSNLVTTLVIFSIVLAFLAAWKLSSSIDERQCEELHALHHVHVMMFGEVKTGFGMDVIHLDPKHPRRLALDRVYRALKVRVSEVSRASAEPARSPCAFVLSHNHDSHQSSTAKLRCLCTSCSCSGGSKCGRIIRG